MGGLRRERAKGNPFNASCRVDSVSFGTITGAGTGTMVIPMTFRDAQNNAVVMPSADGICSSVDAWVTDDTAGQVPTATDPSAISCSPGAVMPLGPNNKMFRLIASINGLVTLTIAITTGTTRYLNLRMPDGRVIRSAGLAF